MKWIYINDDMLNTNSYISLTDVTARPYNRQGSKYDAATIISRNSMTAISLLRGDDVETYSMENVSDSTERHRLLGYEEIFLLENSTEYGTTNYASVAIYGAYKFKKNVDYIDFWCPSDSFIPFTGTLEIGNEKQNVVGIDGSNIANLQAGNVGLTNTNTIYYLSGDNVVNNYLITDGEIYAPYSDAVITFDGIQYVPSFFAEFLNKYFDRVYEDVESVDIIFYNNSAEPNRVDKTDYLSTATIIKGTFREAVSIGAPTITLNFNGIFNYNYMYIPIFNRYYFITDIIATNKNLWTISTEIDVLMSYKDGIKLLAGFVTRNEYVYDTKITDTKRICRNGYNMTKIVVYNRLFDATPTNTSHNFVMTGLGVSVS